VLDERKAAVLEAVINLYIKTAEPVGSKVITEEFDLGVSPATVRNDMAALEEGGYLVQPHTSAGRIPTDKGYRYYVDSLREMISMAEDNVTALQAKLAELKRMETEDLLHEISSLLANQSATISLVLSPGSQRRAYFWGVSQILHQPEFVDTRRVEFLMEFLEGENRLTAYLMNEITEPTVHVRIGSENRVSELNDLSLVAAGYSRDGEPAGIVGLLGPKRMDYGQAIPMVDLTARRLSRLLDEE
jgi:transcriptional regulator of heat shock response